MHPLLALIHSVGSHDVFQRVCHQPGYACAPEGGEITVGSLVHGVCLSFLLRVLPAVWLVFGYLGLG